MKVINKLIAFSVYLLITLCITGCNDDDGYVVEIPEIQKDIVLSQESAKVKIGAENRLELDIVSGNDNYNAFSLNEDVATVHLEGNKILLQGYQNGFTDIIITDTYNNICKIPVQVYTTDKLEVMNDELELSTLLGFTGSIKTSVKLGNGGYSVKSSNPAIAATITEEGIIEITSVSGKNNFTGIITVEDCSKLEAEINVTVISRVTPIYLSHEIEEIVQNKTERYFLNGKNTLTESYYRKVYKVDDNNYTYGWNFYGENSFFIRFTGDNTIGAKDGATFELVEWYESLGVKDIDLEIVKNDGEFIWAIYSYTENDALYFGYICSKIAK